MALAAHILVALALVISELLPFLPTKANGILQVIAGLAKQIGAALLPKDAK